MTVRPLFALTLLLLNVTACSEKRRSHNPSVGADPEQAISTFRLAEGFEMELVASEPLVSDPVAMEVDEYGNFYVVEMHGYPLDTGGSGIVKLLIDADHDGRMDEAKVFADGLVLPTGIMRWKKGVLVTDAPVIWYLEDTDGDGEADVRDTLVTGFARSNPQHNLNTPLYGLDNWIYLAHERAVTPHVYTREFGDEGASIRFGNGRGDSLPRNANGRSVRLKPDRQALEMLSGESQFGHTFDPWGHLLGTSNAHHLFHEAIAARYINRNENLRVDDATQLISDHGDAAEIFPETLNPEHQLLTDIGVITSSCGVTWYTGGLFPEEYNQVTFIAEPVHNLVHADVVQPRGASFEASRVFPNREFLASTDGWSRPVNFYVGPDGALYMIDYYRRYIEHPEWMDEETAASGALYEGADQGRIYRIVPKGTPPLRWAGQISLGSNTTRELIMQLSNPNLWWRRHAQRLLVDRNDAESLPLLNGFLSGAPTPEGVVHALWLLDELNLLTADHIDKAIRHDHAGVRENAIRIAERHLNEWPAVHRLMLGCADDPDPKVRFQVLCTLGSYADEASRLAREKITFADIEDYWVQVSALSAASGQEFQLLSAAVEHFGHQQSTGRSKFIEQCAVAVGLSGVGGDIHKAVAIATTGPANGWWKAPVLEGLAVAFRERDVAVPPGFGDRLISLFSSETDSLLRRGAVNLLQVARLPGMSLAPALEKARAVAANSRAPTNYRADALRLLSLSTDASDAALYQQLLSPAQPESIQMEALAAAFQLSKDSAIQTTFRRWPALTPSSRRFALRQILSDAVYTQQLLSTIASGEIKTETLEWPFKVRLMNYHQQDIRSRARTLLMGGAADRLSVVKAYGAAISDKGLPAKGAQVFQKNCAACHQVNNRDGVDFGPDLAAIRNRERQFILLDILHPNRSIADGFDLWTVEEKSGKVVTGVLSGQTASSITLKMATGEKVMIRRSDIKSAGSDQSSAMPEGLEQSITVEEMTDLLAFLKGGG